MIRFYANLRRRANRPSIQLDSASFPTLRDVLVELIRLFPEMHPDLFEDQGNLRQDLPIFVNGRNPRLHSAGIDGILEEDDVISIFSPIASGRMNVEVLRQGKSSASSHEAQD